MMGAQQLRPLQAGVLPEAQHRPHTQVCELSGGYCHAPSVLHCQHARCLRGMLGEVGGAGVWRAGEVEGEWRAGEAER